MKLSVYSLKKILFQGNASLLNCKTAAGEVTILENHRPLIGILTEGIIKIIDSDNKEHLLPIKCGLLDVREKSEVRCIVED